MRPSAWIMLALLLVLAVTSFVFVRVEGSQGQSFILAQRNAQRLTVAGVERVVRTAPEDVHGPTGRSATCIPSGHVGLRNPWHCTIFYRHGVRDQYTVQIRLNGSYVGTNQVIYDRGQITRGGAEITGCCIVVP
ncbi:MAG TPA: hypothetical protein VFP55_00580 [Solirubrobacteraceae bacterium]|nr:hypothetical protein [Solirubrobacteraceae bacterium]